ncbi:MAG: hypothetical protein AAFU59_12110 [Pseudomonadota bacterium]
MPLAPGPEMLVEGTERYQDALGRMLGGSGGSAHNLATEAVLTVGSRDRVTVTLGGNRVGHLAGGLAQTLRVLSDEGNGAPLRCAARINGRFGTHLTVSLMLVRPPRILS